MANPQAGDSPWRTALVQWFVTAVPVVADRRGADERLGLVRQLGQAARNEAGAQDAAVRDRLLVRFSESAGDVLAREVNHRVEALEGLGVNLAGCRVPADLVRRR